MTVRRSATSADERSYSEAIEHLTAVVELLDRPGEGLGYVWGLLRGQAGYFHVVHARDELRRLRDDLSRHERIAAAAKEASRSGASETATAPAPGSVGTDPEPTPEPPSRGRNEAS